MKDLTQGKTFKTLLLFAVPMLIAGLLSQSYNLIDLVIAGQAIGSDALSATGCTSTFIQFLSSLFWGFGVAVSTIVGQLFGKRKKDEIVTVCKTTLLFIGIVMFFLCLVCIIFARLILTLLKVDMEIFEAAKQYFQIYMIALFIQAISYQITCILQSLGNSKYPMIMTIISGFGNLLLNLLFVLVFQMGINGLAYATIVSCLISFVMGILKMISTIHELDGKMNMEFSFSELRLLSKLAVPCILQQCSLYLSSVIVQPFINDMGKEVSAGYSIAMNVNLIFNAMYHSISRAVASYTAQSKGMKKYRNYRRGIYIGFLQQFLLIMPWMILCFLFPKPVFSIFLQNHDDNCLPYALSYVTWCLPFLFFICIGNLMHSFYKSVESVKTVLVSTLLFSVSRIAFTYLLPPKDNLFSVYMGLSLSWVVEAVVLMGIYYLGWWKSKEQKEFEKTKKSTISS